MKKILVVSALLGLTPLLLQAQTQSGSQRKVSRVEIKSTANQMAAGIMAAEAALTPEELAVAQQVHVGVLPCELGAHVTVAADPHSIGYFDVQINKSKFRMFPVATTTGAIRLEDKRAGVVWLQLPNKSMMLNQKIGQRLADVCTSPAQMVVAQNMDKKPPPSLLDAPTAATATTPVTEIAIVKRTIN